jgi:nucleoside-diphosphate-sugar epimerase
VDRGTECQITRFPHHRPIHGAVGAYISPVGFSSTIVPEQWRLIYSLNPMAGANNVRSLVYVDNLTDALIACATHPAAAGQTYLVSDDDDVSTAMLVEKIARALGRNSRAFYFPRVQLRAMAAVLRRAEQVDRLFGSLRVNDEKIRRELAWFPPYKLEQGLRATAEWYP